MRKLIKSALDARKNAYAPYSNFYVAAAVLCDNNKIYTGFNIENAAYSTSICAERVAIYKAISEGAKKIKAIAICGGNKELETPKSFVYPCGVCRQVLAEFVENENCKIIIIKNEKEYKEYTFNELLPFNFNSDSLNDN